MFNLKSCELPLTYKWYWIVLDVIHTITWFSNKRGGMTAKKVKKARSVFVQINRTEQKKACCWPGKHICLQYCRRGFAKGFPFLYRAHTIQNIILTLRIQIFFHITCCLFWSFDYQNSDGIFNHRLFFKKNTMYNLQLSETHLWERRKNDSLFQDWLIYIYLKKVEGH